MVYVNLADDLNGNVVRELIATALREVADEICRDHVRTITQEAHITSRIGQALEQRLRNSHFGGYTVDVLTQDFPDRGRGALEHRVGADIYLGIRVMRAGRVEMSKGILAQAKLGPNLSGEAGRRLTHQCEKMRTVSPASYVWVYTTEGVGVVNVEDVIRRNSRKLTNRRRLDQVLSETLQCAEGDPAIGLPTGRDIRPAVGAMLQELGVQTGIAVSIIADGDR